MRNVHPAWWILLLVVVAGISTAALLLPQFGTLIGALSIIALAFVIIWNWFLN
jgi:hypothetical protein